jgi:hypothetical protein
MFNLARGCDSPTERLLYSKVEAAKLLSISVRSLEYLIASAGIKESLRSQRDPASGMRGIPTPVASEKPRRWAGDLTHNKDIWISSWRCV